HHAADRAERAQPVDEHVEAAAVEAEDEAGHAAPRVLRVPKHGARRLHVDELVDERDVAALRNGADAAAEDLARDERWLAFGMQHVAGLRERSALGLGVVL